MRVAYIDQAGLVRAVITSDSAGNALEPVPAAAEGCQPVPLNESEQVYVGFQRGEGPYLTTIYPPTIEDARTRRFWEIDAKTSEIISRGFDYKAKIFSLSLASQSSITQARAFAADGIAPLDWPTKDDLDFVTLPDEASILAFAGAAAAVVRDARLSGVTIKAEVAAAQTIAEVLAVVDPRA